MCIRDSTHTEQQSSDGRTTPFALNLDGTVTLNARIEPIDFAAEQITRELMQ